MPDQPMQMPLQARSVSVHPGYGYPPGYVVMRPGTQPRAVSPRSVSPVPLGGPLDAVRI